MNLKFCLKILQTFILANIISCKIDIPSLLTVSTYAPALNSSSTIISWPVRKWNSVDKEYVQMQISTNYEKKFHLKSNHSILFIIFIRISNFLFSSFRINKMDCRRMFFNLLKVGSILSFKVSSIDFILCTENRKKSSHAYFIA